jgi:DNA-binding response OmpR family regulator
MEGLRLKGATMISNFSYEQNEYPIAMVAEDDDAVRARISDYLRDKGYGVLEAKTSVEALLLGVEYPGRIDVLFTALDLRKYCNGAELAGCLRAARPEMSVFYLGGNGECSEDVTRELVMGQAMLLKKPVSGPRLDEAVRMLDQIRSQADISAMIGRM